jgi:biopolymer transport protein ExbD
MAVKIKKGMVAYQLPVTPMIDLVFNLLLFYIMATTFASEERQLSVNLPSASEARPLSAAPRELVIDVDRQGAYFLAGKAVELADLQESLRKAAVDNPLGTSVTIRADERCYWRDVVAAVNACIRAGVTDYRVTTGGPSP